MLEGFTGVVLFVVDFWLVVVFVMVMVGSCIGCCVRAARRRREQQYYRISSATPRGYGTHVVYAHHTTPPAYDTVYAGQAPVYQQAAGVPAYQAAPGAPVATPAYEPKADQPPAYQ